MAIHLVGETIDKTRSHYRAETGKLVQLMRGIYVDADDDIEASVGTQSPVWWRHRRPLRASDGLGSPFVLSGRETGSGLVGGGAAGRRVVVFAGPVGPTPTTVSAWRPAR